MNLNGIKHLFIGLYLTNSYGLKLRKIEDPQEKKRLRLAYAKAQLEALNITVTVENPEMIPTEGKYLLISNHRSIIDPPVLEVALCDSTLFGLWVSKKELYNSPFFGLFVRNAGSILLDREKSQMSGFFADVKKGVSEGSSIFIFPEGTRNKTDKPLGTFKDGSRIIAMKNRLPILPVYIQTHAGETLKAAIKDDKTPREIVVRFGEPLPYKSRENLETAYRDAFDIS